MQAIGIRQMFGGLTVVLGCTALALSEERNMSQRRIEENVVYGMHGGLALLMDVHYPAKPNGFAVLYIPGCAWHQSVSYGATQLKDLNTGFELADRFNKLMVEPLIDAGYCVFIINHRAAPLFRYPAAVQDAQRAVRFIRHNAERFGVDPGRIGACGYSSGGHLAALLGLLNGNGDPSAMDPVERQSAKVQCVIAGGTPSDLADMQSPMLAPSVASFLGMLTMFAMPGSPEQRTTAEASPLTHVSSQAAAFFIFHGEKDEVMPVAHAERLAQKLREANAMVELLVVPGASHINIRPQGGPDFVPSMVNWLNQHLRDR